MDREPGKNKNKRFRLFFHISKHIFIFILLVVLTAVSLRPFQKIVQNQMVELRDRLISQAEQILERRIVYSSIGPSIFGTLDIRNIRIYGDDVSPVMTIAKLRISYSLLTLIQGKIVESLQAVRIDRPVISLDKTRDADLIRLFSPSPKTEEGNSDTGFNKLSDFLPENVLFRVRNGEAGITGEANQFKMEGLTFDASMRQGRLRLDGKGNVGLALQDILSEPIDVHLSFQFSGEWAADFQSGNLIVNMTSFSKDMFYLQPITVNLAMEDDQIVLKKINDSAAFDFSLDYTMSDKQLAVLFSCEHFSPRDSLRFAGPWQDFNQWLALRTSGTATFKHNPNQGIEYTLAFSGNVPTNLPIGDASFEIKGGGNQEHINFHNLSVKIAQGALNYQGDIRFDPLLPEGVVSVSDFSFSGSDKITASLEIHSKDKKIWFEGKTLYFGSLPLSDLTGSIFFEDQSLNFETSLLCAREHEEPSKLSLEGFFDYKKSPYIEMSLALNSLAVTDVMDMIRPFKNMPNLSEFVPIPALNPLNQVAVHTTLYIATDFKRLSYNVPDFVITYQDREELFVGAMSGTDRRFQLNEGRVRWEGVDLQTSAQAEFTTMQDISFSLRATYLDTPYYLEGMILDQNSISIHGLYGLRVYINRAESEGYSGYVEIENLPLPYQGQTARFSMKSSLRYDSPEFWFFDLDRLEIADILSPLSVNAAGTVLGISGRADQQGAVFRDLFFDDGRGVLQGTVYLSWNRNFSDVSGNITLNNDAGNEWYAIKAQVKDKGLTVKLEGVDMQLGRFVPNVFNAVASGNLDLVWDAPASFSADLNLSSFSAQVSDREVRITGEASLTPETFYAQELHLRYGDIHLDMSSAVLNRHESWGEAEGQFQMIAPNRDMDVSFTAELIFKPIDSWSRLQDAVNSFEGSLSITAARFNAIHIEEPFDFNFSRTNALISLSGGPQDMIRLQFADTGDFYAGLSNPSPVRGTVIGTINIAGSTIDVQSPDMYIDLTSLWRFIPSEVKQIINITGGFVTASVQVSGPLTDPEFFGTAEGNSVRLEVSQYLTREVRPVPVAVVLDGNEMSFGPTPASVGTGQGTVAGWFRFDQWVPDTFSLDIRVPQKSAIPFGFDIMGVIAHGKASGYLNVAMADKVVTVSGDVTGDDTEITLNADELAAANQLQEVDDPFDISVVVDITIRSGRKVEFLWPNAQWPILQTSASMGSVMRIRNDTLNRRYSFIGDVNLRSGEVFYFERSFYIREGVLSFNENENHFDPRISVRAEVRDQISTGPVTISMIVDNAPLQSFTARFEASPPLSQVEILSLLGQNITGVSIAGEPTTNTGQIPLLSSTADILAQTQIYRRFQRGVRDILALDMLSFRTQMAQNFLIQSFQRQQTSDDTVDKTGIGNYFDNTTVFIGKYLTSAMFLQGMVSLRYGENRTIFKGLTTGGYALEPDLGIELRGPAFDIQVHLAFLHLESLFLKDVSISLTRRRSTFEDMFFRFP